MSDTLKWFLVGTMLVFLYNHSNAQNYNFYWDKSYGGDSRDWNCKISSNAQGELFLIGDSQSDISGNKTTTLCNNQEENGDIWLMKIDTAGAILWQKGYGGEADERAPNLFHLNNAAQEMIIACYSTSDIACEKTEPNRDTVPTISADYWIIKVDASGNIIWEKTIGGDNFDDKTIVAGLPNGDLLIAGESNSPVGYDKTVPNNTISNDYWVLKLDASGNILWDQVYGGNNGESLSALIVNNDGSFLLAGNTNSDMGFDVSEPGQGNYDYWMIKLDASGTKLWDKRFGGTGPEICNDAKPTADGGYILCGYTVSPMSGDVSQSPKGFQDYWIVKTDSAGNKIWDKRFGGTMTDGSFGTSVMQTLQGNYWVSGFTNGALANDISENSYGGSDYWILNLNQSGDKIWDKRFGGNGDEFNNNLISLSDSTLMLFGTSDSGSSAIKTAPNRGWLDNWLIKFSYTDSTTSLNIPVQQQAEFISYPNPATDIINIQLISNNNNLDLKQTVVKLTDISGRIVEKWESIDFLLHDKLQLHASTFSIGIYTLSIENKDNIVFRKLISIQ